ncbi:MAG: dTDP-4-dehydrorhamnose 3,5-epimerase [Pseudomonadota bacterium]
MNVIETVLPGVLVIEPTVHGDHRGFFLESYRANQYAELGINQPFVQDNHSRSQYGVLRGLHFQISQPQGKLVRVTRGSVFDVAVDVNPESDTYGQHVGVELSDDNHRLFWVPPGYAHGFVVTSETADFQYKCTDYYQPADEGGVVWNDPDIGINWPVKLPTLSEKDLALPRLAEYTGKQLSPA